MSDMIDLFRAMKSYGQEERRANRREARDTVGKLPGWVMHSDVHWQRIVNKKLLDYWPGTKKWRYNGRTQTGDVVAFIASIEGRRCS